MFAFCARRTGDLALAEDLTSVVFLEAWRRRRSVQLTGASALPWLLGTAHNVVRNQRRSLRRHRAVLARLSAGGVSPSGEEAPSGEEDVIARVDAQRTLATALRVVDCLPQGQRDAVNLVLWSGLSYEDAAQALGVPIGTVRSRVARAQHARRVARHPATHYEGVLMTNLTTPPVPDLSSEWITARRTQLVREITTPQRQPVSRRLALRGVGALAGVGAATTVALVAIAGTGAANAFAGWTATPTRPASGETASALAQCTSRLAGSGGGQSGVPAGGWQPVLTDTRGPFTSMILQSGAATATCLTGPSFTTTEANATEGGASQHVLSNGSASAGAPPAVSIMGLGGSGSGPIEQASQSQLTTTGGQPYTFVQGQVAADVSGVTLLLSDASNVQATVADGSFVAWWPGRADATSAQVTSASGATTQQLTFTPVAPSNSAS